MDRDGEKQQTMEEARGGELPGDIMLEVLVRLPAKALCRFRCVSKAWHALISDPAFILAQRSRAGPHLVTVSFGVGTRPPEVTVFDMDGNVVRQLEVRLLDKDDDGGLLLLQLQRATTTMRSNLICADAMIIDLVDGRACVVRTDARLTALSTIGRAAMSGAIKVISLEQCLELAAPFWRIGKVATISMNCAAEPLTWRQRCPPPFDFSWHPGRRATVNGIVYFMASRFSECYGASNSGRGLMAAFDLESERWKMVNGPALLETQDKIWYPTLMEIKGCLGLVQFRGHCPYNRFEPYEDDWYSVIWLLVDPGKSLWVKDCTIQMSKTWILVNQLWALDDGRILLLVKEFVKKVVTKENKIIYLPRHILVFFNPSTSTFTKFRDKPVCPDDKFVLYTGSLLS